jgi:hypothetical protein
VTTQDLAHAFAAAVDEVRVQSREAVEHRHRDVVPEARFAATKLRRAKPTSPSTFPLSLPLAGRQKRSRNRGL